MVEIILISVVVAVVGSFFFILWKDGKNDK